MTHTYTYVLVQLLEAKSPFFSSPPPTVFFVEPVTSLSVTELIPLFFEGTNVTGFHPTCLMADVVLTLIHISSPKTMNGDTLVSVFPCLSLRRDGERRRKKSFSMSSKAKIKVKHDDITTDSSISHAFSHPEALLRPQTQSNISTGSAAHGAGVVPSR